jgi:hypothetical protein
VYKSGLLEQEFGLHELSDWGDATEE